MRASSLAAHRLLLKPGGFEGLTLGLKHPSPNQLTVAELEELKERGRFHPNPAPGSFSTNSQHAEDAMLVQRHALLQVQSKASKGVQPGLKERPDPFRAAIRPGI